MWTLNSYPYPPRSPPPRDISTRRRAPSNCTPSVEEGHEGELLGPYFLPTHPHPNKLLYIYSNASCKSIHTQSRSRSSCCIYTILPRPSTASLASSYCSKETKAKAGGLWHPMTPGLRGVWRARDAQACGGGEEFLQQQSKVK